MRSSVSVLLLFILPCFYWNARASDSQLLAKERCIYGPAKFIFDSNVATSRNGIVYASCYSKFPKEINCNVTLELDSSHKESNNNCNVKLVVGDDEDLTDHRILLSSFADHKAIISWIMTTKNFTSHKQYLQVKILDMKNCSSKQLNFNIDSEKNILKINLVLDENTFDVFVSDRKFCSSDQCRISFDQDGRQIGDPVPYTTSIPSVTSILKITKSKGKAFLFIGSKGDKYRVESIGDTGAGTLVTELDGSSPYPFSNSHGVLGLCWMTIMEINKCGQFNVSTNTRKDATFYLPKDVRIVALHNLIGGGFILLTWNDHCDDKIDNICKIFEVIQLDNVGRKIRSIGLADVKLKCNILRAAITETIDKYCFYFVCLFNEYGETGNAKNTLKFINRCILKNYDSDMNNEYDYDADILN